MIFIHVAVTTSTGEDGSGITVEKISKRPRHAVTANLKIGLILIAVLFSMVLILAMLVTWCNPMPKWGKCCCCCCCRCLTACLDDFCCFGDHAERQHNVNRLCCPHLIEHGDPENSPRTKAEAYRKSNRMARSQNRDSGFGFGFGDEGGGSRSNQTSRGSRSHGQAQVNAVNQRPAQFGELEHTIFDGRFVFYFAVW